MYKRLAWLAALTVTGCAPLEAAELVVDTHGDRGDRVPSIAVTGLNAAEPIDLRLEMRDARGQVWRSSARLRADLDGVADTATSAAEQGSYRGIDAAGLLWSMQPESGTGTPSPLPLRHSPDGLLYEAVPMRLSVLRDGELIASRVLERRLSAPGVVAQVVQVAGVSARLYLPADVAGAGATRPAVVTLGGAEGGIEAASAYAAWLASNGYVALAVGYYRMDGRPKDLINVPIEPVLDAVTWLQQQPGVDPERIGVMGGSWGGIVAMAAAAHDTRLRSVVSWVGSPAPFRGIRRDVAPADYRGVDLPPLTWKGTPLGYLPYREAVDWSAPTAADAALLEQAMLPIERINGPVLLVAGGDDQLGDSGRMAAVAERWLRARRAVPMDDEVAYYSDAGHLITQMLQPTTFRHQTGPHLQVGGTAEGYARADRDSSQRVLAFLARTLVRPLNAVPPPHRRAPRPPLPPGW